MDNSMDKIRKILIRAVSAAAFFAAALVMHINAGAAGSGYILPVSSTQYLTEDMVSPMSAQIACYARNEIYARNGRMFDSAELQGYFNQQSWYMPVYEPDQFPDNLLNEYETANIAMLSSYEQQLGGYPTDGGSYSYDPVYQYMTSSGGTDSADDLTVNPDTCVLTNPALLQNKPVLADFVYNPLNTRFLQMGREAGCRTFDGLGMLLWQGALAFKLWTGQDMPVAAVRQRVFHQ